MAPRDPLASSSLSASERPPRLVLVFAVLTALGVAAAAAVIFVVVRHADESHAKRHATERAAFAARSVVGPALRTSDLEARVTAERRRRLDRLVAGRVFGEEIRAVTLYRPDGRRTYSGADGYAPAEATRDRVQSALAGATVSETVRAEDGSRSLRTYVPVADERGEIMGVVRIDQAYGPIAGMARRSALLIAGVLEGLLLLLFVALVPLLARATSRIGGHLAELERVATHDELTGLPNRYGFRRLAAARLEQRTRAAVMLVDLDGFSEINASLGPESGDRLLADAGARLQEALQRDDAVVARLGEDEFGVLHAGDGAEAERVAERIRRAFAAPFEVDGVRIAVDLDIGVCLFPTHGTDVETLLGHASAALLSAKAEGRSSVQVYAPDLGADDRCRLAVVAELREALAEGQLRVHYQPQADLLTHNIRGVEALLRWEHPERGLLSAGEFLTYGERGGLSQELRRFVVATAALQWQEWRALGLDLELAVNLSPVDMLDPALPDEIEDATRRFGIPPWNLVLEVTERTLIGDERRARQVVERLERIGVRLSIDDFGTGYSSLASLRTFPIHQVKLDRSLLADVPGDEAAEAIVGGSVEIAHGLGALVVAEGIERREQWRFAAVIGCDIAQGYLVGRPGPPEQLVELLDAPRVVPLSVV